METVDDEETVCHNNNSNNNRNSSGPASNNNNNNLNNRRLSLADIMITKIRKNSNPDYLSGSDELRGDKKDIKIDIPYMTAEKFADKRVKVSTGTLYNLYILCVFYTLHVQIKKSLQKCLWRVEYQLQNLKDSMTWLLYFNTNFWSVRKTKKLPGKLKKIIEVN